MTPLERQKANAPTAPSPARAPIELDKGAICAPAADGLGEQRTV